MDEFQSKVILIDETVLSANQQNIHLKLVTTNNYGYDRYQSKYDLFY